MFLEFIAVIIGLVMLGAVYLEKKSREKCSGLKHKETGAPAPYPSQVLWNNAKALVQLMTGEFRKRDKMTWDNIQRDKFPGAREGQCMQSEFFGFHFFTTWNADMARQILFAKEDQMGKLLFGEAQAKLIKDSILLEEGERWKTQRQVLSPSFQWEHIKSVMGTFVSTTNELISLWNFEKPTSIEVFPMMQKATLDIIGEAGFGFRFGSLTNSHSNELKAYHDMIAELSNPLHFFENIDGMIGTKQKLTNKLEKFESFIKDLISQKREKFNKMRAEGVDPSLNASDILDLLVLGHAGEDGVGLSDRELIANMNTFFIAGHETTAAALANTLFLLAENPECQRQCQEEIERVCQGRTPTYEEIKELGYLNNCLKESLRLHPPVSIVVRTVRDDIVIGDYILPKGTNAAVNVYMLHRNPEYWPEPAKFQPDRFEKNNLAKRLPYAWMTFSMGPRQCIGNNFAMLEMKTVLSMLLQKYDFSIDTVSPKFEEYLGLAMCPPPGCKLILTPRSAIKNV